MAIRECDFGNCDNPAELEQAFGKHKILICPAHRIGAYRLANYFRKIIFEHDVRLTIEFYEALKKGGIGDE